MLGNILFYGGIGIAIIGGLGIIRFDGSIKRVIICGAMIIAGLACLAVGQGKRNTAPIKYEIVEVQSLNNNDTQYRVTLKAGGNSTILYVDNEEVKDFVEGGTIELTAPQLKEYQ